MKSPELVVTRVINAPINRVWQAWTNPDDIKHWFVAEHKQETEVIEFNVKVGGKVRLKFPGAGGEYTWTYIKIDKPDRLVFDILDFSLPQFNKEGAGGICTVSFKDLGGKTEVSVGGELPDESMRQMAERGWGGTLNNLNNYLNPSTKLGVKE